MSALAPDDLSLNHAHLFFWFLFVFCAGCLCVCMLLLVFVRVCLVFPGNLNLHYFQGTAIKFRELPSYIIYDALCIFNHCHTLQQLYHSPPNMLLWAALNICITLHYPKVKLGQWWHDPVESSVWRARNDKLTVCSGCLCMWLLFLVLEVRMNSLP